MSASTAARLFLSFAFAYFFSTLVRAVTATLAPSLQTELALGPADLGLLSGAYFVGFAVMQLPVGAALDRWGPVPVLRLLLLLAAAGCAAFGLAQSVGQLMLARLAIGIGVSACLMAPLTAYRQQFSHAIQLRAGSWMLMTGSLGMLASTVPVQWLLPVWGWRGIFAALAAVFLLAAVLAGGGVPLARAAAAAPSPADQGSGHRGLLSGFAEVFGHPAFVRVAPIGFFVYGAMLAMQSLWIGPWLTQVGDRSAAGAAGGLFVVNLSMLVAFWSWGWAVPWLTRRGWGAERLIRLLLPASLLLLATIVVLGPVAGAGHWAAWCVCTSVVSLSQAELASFFPARMAGRALTAFNLVVFAGVFAQQWGIGLVIDGLLASGVDRGQAFRAAIAACWVSCVLSWAWMEWQCRRADRTRPTTAVAPRS